MSNSLKMIIIMYNNYLEFWNIKMINSSRINKKQTKYILSKLYWYIR